MNALQIIAVIAGVIIISILLIPGIPNQFKKFKEDAPSSAGKDGGKSIVGKKITWKSVYVPIIIIVVLIFTNPSLKSFKNYIGSFEYSSHSGNIAGQYRKILNVFIFSYYTYNYNGEYSRLEWSRLNGKYIGIAGNFIKLNG
ncbi:hypothetical protein [Parafilimonas terrae]|nr:hypothetical protein [Parafilimonas terrae]